MRQTADVQIWSDIMEKEERADILKREQESEEEGDAENVEEKECRIS